MTHRAPFAALGLTATAAVAACKAFVALREASGGALGLRVWDPDSHPAVFVFRLALCNARTAATWVLAGACATLLIALAPAARRAVKLAATGLAAVAAMLAVVDVQIYHVFHRFLDAALIDIGRGGGHGYIEPYAPPAAWAAFFGLPVLVVGAAFALVRAFRDDLDGAARWVFNPAIAGALAGGLWMSGAAAEKWCGQGRGDFANDPLIVLARSYEVLLRGGGAAADITPEEAARLAPEKVGPVAPGPIKNVVLVIWDGVPAAALTLYGSSQRTTPVLASRTDALVFDRFYSNATQSAPSALALFGSTFNDPAVYVTVTAYPNFRLPHVATWMQDHGRTTSFVGDDGWTSLGRVYLRPYKLAIDAMTDWSEKPSGLEKPRFQVAASSYALARKLIAQAGDRPFFTTIWSSEAHPPFRAGDCPEKFDVSKFPELPPNRVDDYARFLACCWREDHELGELLADLERSGKAKDTLVIVTADHGCGWGQHGYFGYGAGLYDEIVRVPLVLISPALPTKGRSAAVGTHVDLWPTVSRLMGLPRHEAWQGRDLLEPAAVDRPAYFSCLGEMGLRRGRYKYIWNHGRDTDELYDLEADPGERTNVSPAHRDLAKGFRRELEALAAYQSRHIRARSQ